MNDLYEIEENSKKFCEFYGNKLNDIFEEIYNAIKRPGDEETNLIYILYEVLKKIKKIEIKKYNLICYIEINYIVIKNIKENLWMNMIYLKKVELHKIDKTEEIWVCNDDMAMLTLNKEKFLYYLKPKYLVKDPKEGPSEITIISDLTLLNFVIINDINIYSSDSSFFQLSDLKKEFEKKIEDIKIQNYLEGISSYNFKSIFCPEKVEFLFGNININNILKKNHEKFQKYLYNQKIGLTMELLVKIDKEKFINKKIKFLYVNTSIVFNENSKLIVEKFLAYYIAKLFSNYEEFEKFYGNLIAKISKKKYNRERMLYKIVKYIIKNYESSFDKLYFIFDNIYDYHMCLNMETTYKNLNKKIQKENIFFAFFVQLNYKNLELLTNNKENSKFIFINNDIRINPEEYINNLDKDFWHRLDSFDDIKTSFESIISKKNNIDVLSLLLKIKYIPHLLRCSTNEKYINEILSNFLEYFHLTCANNNGIQIQKIQFKNERVKKFFNEKFNSMICDIVVSDDLKMIDYLINKSVEGILLEKQIILCLISSMIFKKLKIDKIFCFSNFPKNFEFFFGEKILIIQLNDNSPLYDFGVITYFNNEIILKIYQVGINKDNYSLEKLDEDIIQFDLEYFLKKLKLEFGVDIKKYVFGIITSKSGFDKNVKNKKNIENINQINNNIFYSTDNEEDLGENLDKEYKNFNVMKKFCDKMNYEFIIFDKNTKKSYIEENGNLINFEFIDETNERFIRNIYGIYDNCDVANLKKMPLNKNDYPNKYDIKSILKYNFEVKYVSKFRTKNKKVPDINRYNFFLFFEDLDGKFCIKGQNRNIICNSNIVKDIDKCKSDNFIGCIINKANDDNYKGMKIKFLKRKTKNENDLNN